MDWIYESKKLAEGYSHIIGCDEVGRGCLAGPVVAAAVVLKNEPWGTKSQIKDSKLLSPKKREELSEQIKEHSVAWSIAEVSPEEIDKINIHQASLLAMKKAVENLSIPSASEESLSTRGNPQLSLRDGKVFIYVDGKFKIPNFDFGQETIIGGDNKVLSIAAASIIAKVYRDELMAKLHETYPVYNFAKHKGYATADHRRIISLHGLSPIHRLTFKIKEQRVPG